MHKPCAVVSGNKFLVVAAAVVVLVAVLVMAVVAVMNALPEI